MAQKQMTNRDIQLSGVVPEEAIRVDEATIVSAIDRVLEILKSLPMLRRYGDDATALKEAQDILEKVKEKL